ncbi:ACP S-malonyltransferase [Geoalkalibacter halelectricus]|uniref:Malonyl CoA-acyl carrier protein transacylase n=2 Tax=Geoalkalibacter halelectricus TaxID=2847045 RepID=A0ABY5ZMS9_9BACT|nr:ACP S-malonyltransferase [Geoalkalibacter halelectricus]
MGKDLAENFAIARQTFEEADQALGLSLSRLCFDGPEEDLKLTENTQPAILATSVAALRVLLQERGLAADYVAGHSLGEFSALVCAGGMDFADALRTVRRRGQLMQQAVPVGEGAMAAIIGLEADAVENVCALAADGQVVAPANFNSPGQIVIAGNTQAVDRAIALAKEKGAKRALPLPVSAPFHCALMEPAGRGLDEVLAGLTFGSLRIPVVTNVEARSNDRTERIRELLVTQVSAPVRWQESVEFMAKQGVSRMIEIGPGKVLSGLIKRIAKNVEVGNLEDTGGLQKL